MNYRIYVPRMAYRGGDRRKQEKQRRDAALCEKIESALQRRYDSIEPGEIRVILFYEIANEIGADPKTVRSIMSRIQGGSNGVMYRKPALRNSSQHTGASNNAIQPEVAAPSDDSTTDGRLLLHGSVTHKIFGNGIVAHIDGDLVLVNFNECGSKRVVGSFLEPSPH